MQRASGIVADVHLATASTGVRRWRAAGVNAADNLAIAGTLGDEVQLLARHQLRSQPGVLEKERKLPGAQQDSELEARDQFQLVQTAVALDVVEECLLKGHHGLRLGTHLVFAQRELTQRVQHSGAINLLRTPRRAGQTRYAGPDRSRSQCKVVSTELQQPDQLIRHQVHMRGDRTAGRTLATLVAVRDLAARERLNARGLRDSARRFHGSSTNTLCRILRFAVTGGTSSRIAGHTPDVWSFHAVGRKRIRGRFSRGGADADAR